jgi:hypothetical protein
MKTLLLTIAVCCVFGTAAGAACNPTNPSGSQDCPVFTAPATTAVPLAAMGGTLPGTQGLSVVLFGGAVPPNGFMVGINLQSSLPLFCAVNDNGPANAGSAGFLFGGASLSLGNPSAAHVFVTPPGYKPMGPVSVNCQAPVEYRGW